MAEKRITNDFEVNYRLVGIATTLKEYKVGFHLNHILQADFRKLKDLLFESRERERNVFFSVLKSSCDDEMTEYTLFANKNGTDTLLPEVATFDYLLQVNGKFPPEDLAKAIGEIKKLNQVLLCTEIPVKKIKNHHRLIYEEEKPSTRPLFKNRFGIKK